ncbi:hypothetical protein I4U23_027488, partial [Adineta vaga]
QDYNTTILFVHLLDPFIANFLSALFIIIASARRRTEVHKKQTYKQLVISPITLLLLSTSRLSGCISLFIMVLSMTNASLFTLPSELFDLIFKHLDTLSITLSFRHVCKRFYEITDEYNQYELDLNSISNLYLKRILRLIKPENITSIIFDGESNRSSGIQLLFSLIDISRLTRIRSITLDLITNSKDYELLNRLVLSNLNSLSIHTRGLYQSDSLAFLSKVMTQGTLNQLYLIKAEFITKNIPWPNLYTIKHLTIKSCSLTEYHLILQGLTQLRRLVTGQFIMDKYEPLSSTCTHYRQLMSLTIGNSSLSMTDFELVLSFTPSLLQLKLLSYRSKLDSIINGSDWTHLIQNKLSDLKTFQFYFSYNLKQTDDIKHLDLIINQFRTSFWLQEKKWIITCDYVLESKMVNFYTTPLRTMDFEECSLSNKII